MNHRRKATTIVVGNKYYVNPSTFAGTVTALVTYKNSAGVEYAVVVAEGVPLAAPVALNLNRDDLYEDIETEDVVEVCYPYASLDGKELYLTNSPNPISATREVIGTLKITATYEKGVDRATTKPLDVKVEFTPMP